MALSFSSDAQNQIIEIRKQYPTSQAACMPLLHLAQKEFGHLSDEAIHLVAQILELPVAHVFGVVTFYTMYHRKPVGKRVLMMCTNISCMLRGAQDTLSRLESHLGIQAGETSADGEFTLIEEECLAACADAPAMVCGERYFLNLTPDKVEVALAECRKSPETLHSSSLSTKAATVSTPKTSTVEKSNAHRS